MARLKRKKIYKNRFIGFRCTDEQYNEIKLKANIYCDGVMSEYIVHSAMNYEVVYDDLEADDIDELIKNSAKSPSINFNKL